MPDTNIWKKRFERFRICAVGRDTIKTEGELDLGVFLAIGSPEMGRSEWLMSASERLALLGLLEFIRPALSLEFGCHKGGATRLLSLYSGQVISVDKDPRVRAVAQALPNVTALCMTTNEASEILLEQGDHFDFALIDAGHSREAVMSDLQNVLVLADIIVMHDMYNPDCRAGALSVLEQYDCYYDLDLIPGGLQPDGLWGGFGLVLTTKPKLSQRFMTERLLQPFSLLIWIWQIKTLPQRTIDKVKMLPRRAVLFMRELVPGPIRRTLRFVINRVQR